MQLFSETVKESLFGLIHNMSAHSWLYSSDPKRDFSRKRKLPFEKMMALLVSMGGHTMRDELLDHFGCDPETASVPAFVQQRAKIMHEALEFLFHEFTDSCSDSILYKGYRLLAVDGSDLQFSADPNDPDSYFAGAAGQKHYSLLHLNALYDLQSKIYLDAVIQKRRNANENAALVQMIERSELRQPVILLADRGYEAYNNIAHLEQKGWKYLFRIKESNGIGDVFPIPKDEAIDYDAHMILTRKQTKAVKALMKENPGLYRHITTGKVFDYLDLHENLFYELRFRIVRFLLSDGTYETVITNLDKESFPADILKELYFRRWGIETSFRQLKYTVALKHFQSKKVEFIFQEIFARLIMYNFCEMITSHVVIQYRSEKYVYQTNFSAVVHICRQFLRGDVTPPKLEATIKRFLTPIRPGRKQPRKLKPNTFKGFLYRIA